MNTLLLHPTDVLFFRDGRPMGGASAGHGAAWPLPNVVSHAFHAALHRAGGVFQNAHAHRRGRSGQYQEIRDRKFGSLVTAGPFPVCSDGAAHTWFFPRPLDADNSGKPVLLPIENTGVSSLPGPLRYLVASTKAPSKETPAPWWSEDTWAAYQDRSDPADPTDRRFLRDADFSDIEHSYGIGISPETGTAEEGRFYSAHSLRLRPGWKLGIHAEASDKAREGRDLIPELIRQDHSILTGGQQRVCTAERLEYETLPFPRGAVITGTRIKWVLLTPAIFPAIDGHPGGWLPSWIRHRDGQVMLKSGGTERQPGERRDQWRKRVSQLREIPARLVAAIVGKPIPVTGYALPNTADPDRADGGAKSTHLAVPAGSVYYFECNDEKAAEALTAALNWHGITPGTEIKNRRSTLMGEKGFGLGVCSTWKFHDEKPAS